jgi:cytoskeletal protein CcmA (bactofilin family)
VSFSRIKVAGWSFGELLTSTQLNALDIDHANAIDGFGGGDYALTAPLNLNDADIGIGQSLTVGDTVTAISLVCISLQVDGSIDCDGSLDVGVDAGITGDLIVGNAIYSIYAYITALVVDTSATLSFATVTNNLTVGNNITIGGKINGTAGTVVVDNDLQVEGEVVGDLTLAANLRVDGDITLAGDLRADGFNINVLTNLEVFGNMNATGATRTPWRKLALPNVDTSINGKDYNLLIAWAGTLSSTHSYSITTTDAVDGDWFWVANRDGGAENININPTTGDNSTVANNAAVLYVYDSSLGWKLVKAFLA